MGQHVFLASKKLAPFTVMDQGDGVGYNSGPVKPLPVCFTHKNLCPCVTTAKSRVNALKNDASFVWQKTPHESAISASPEQLSVEYGIMSYPTT
jgi:hypothetical protein